MTGFDPDAFVAKASSKPAPAFDPDEFVAKAATAKPFDPDVFVAKANEPSPEQVERFNKSFTDLSLTPRTLLRAGGPAVQGFISEEGIGPGLVAAGSEFEKAARGEPQNPEYKGEAQERRAREARGKPLLSLSDEMTKTPYLTSMISGKNIAPEKGSALDITNDKAWGALRDVTQEPVALIGAGSAGLAAAKELGAGEALTGAGSKAVGLLKKVPGMARFSALSEIGGEVGHALFGWPGKVAGRVAGAALSSPQAIEAGVKAGQISADVVNKLAGMEGPLTDETFQRAWAAARASGKTFEGATDGSTANAR